MLMQKARKRPVNDYNGNYNLNQTTNYYANMLEVTINEDNSKGFLKDTSDEMDAF